MDRGQARYVVAACRWLCFAGIAGGVILALMAADDGAPLALIVAYLAAAGGGLGGLLLAIIADAAIDTAEAARRTAGIADPVKSDPA